MDSQFVGCLVEEEHQRQLGGLLFVARRRPEVLFPIPGYLLVVSEGLRLLYFLARLAY